MPFWGSGLQPAPPPGYDYDFINTDILLHHTSVDADGYLHLDSGVRYRLLILSPTTQMTPEVLQKLHDLVHAGATITGPRPLASPSLAHYPSADQTVNALATELWADTDGITKNQHGFGKGTVYIGLGLNDILPRLQTEPDFSSSGTPENSPMWIHRHLADADIYFVANQADRPTHMDLRLRATGSSVELWRPMDATLTPAAFTSGAPVESSAGNRQPGLQPALYTQHANFTQLSVNFAARESVFVVIRNRSQTPAIPASTSRQTLATLHGPWTLTFPPRFGAPANLRLDKLAPWTDSADIGAKSFSGTATYSTTFTAPPSHLSTHYLLHFDDVRDLAAIKINGKSAGFIWAPPYDVDITAALRPGMNTLEVSVTNEWSNRIAADRALPADQRILHDVPPAFPGAPAAPLQPSGLSGEVSIVAVTPERK
jgi:hypothetical protein